MMSPTPSQQHAYDAAHTRGLIIFGPARSSQTLVALALAQHPECRHVLDVSPLPALARAIGAAVPADRASTIEAAGAAAARLLADTAGRPFHCNDHHRATAGGSRPWVTSMTVTGRGDVAIVAAMFPTAHLVHVVRHPDAVVASLASSACGDGRYQHREAGYRDWAAITAELADLGGITGPDRLSITDLRAWEVDPHRCAAELLAKVGLEPDPLCAAPFATLDPATSAFAANETGRSLAMDLYRRVTDGIVSTMAGAHVDPLSRTKLARVDLVTEALADGSGVSNGQDRYRHFVTLALPARSPAVVISKGDPGLVDLPGRLAWHLPGTPDGGYLGHHPANGADALRHLIAATAAGARHLVVPGASRWWLDHYPELGEFLGRSARSIAHHEDIATIYELPTEIPHV